MIEHGLKLKKGKTYSFTCNTIVLHVILVVLHVILKKTKEIKQNEVIRETLRCFNCNHKKSTFLKQHNKVTIELPRIFHWL